MFPVRSAEIRKRLSVSRTAQFGIDKRWTIGAGQDRRTLVATEIAEGGQATLDAIARLQDASLPLEDRYDSSFTDHDPGEGQPAGPGGLA